MVMMTRLAFSNMSKYEEGDTGNRLALWEDLELRRVLPLVPA
jgi:protein SMG7